MRVTGSMYTHLMYLVAIVALGAVLMAHSYNKGYSVAENKYLVSFVTLKSELQEEHAAEIKRVADANLEAKERETQLLKTLAEQAEMLDELTIQAEQEAELDEHRERTCLSAGAAKRVGGVR